MRQGGRQQDDHPPPVTDRTRGQPRRLAGAKKDISPLRALDRAACVLCDHQPPHRVGAMLFDPDWRPQRRVCRVDRYAAQWRHRPVHRPQWPLCGIGQIDLTKKDVGRVVKEQFVPFGRIAAHPIADRLHRHAIGFDNTAMDQLLPDGAIGLAIAAVIAHADRRAIPKPDTARPLNLKKKDIQRVFQPCYFKPASLQ